MSRLAWAASLVVLAFGPPALADNSAPEAPPPAADDPEGERILRLQEALTSIVHGPVLGRLRVGIRVMDAHSGQVLFGERGSVLMDPASNQKVLATATALFRLGETWRFRTELYGPRPDADGVVNGDLVLRGTGDPSLRAVHLELMASQLAARGVTRVDGAVLGDPRRVGAHESSRRSPLRVARSAIEVRVRPGTKAGALPFVLVRPDSEAFVVDNRARTIAKGRSRIKVSLSNAGRRMTLTVVGRIAVRHPGMVVRRVPPNQSLYAAALTRGALHQAGIAVRDPAGTWTPKRPVAVPRTAALSGRSSDVPVALAPSSSPTVLVVHQSDPLPVLIRRINKDSDNEWAERLLETVGAEIYGGAATPEKGIRALREALTELGLPASAYVPVNGSGLGHQNRITADAMADLLRRLFLDPRLGPDILQSLSVGGIDGTTRNRFRGSPAAERVRAKTGTLRGKSILSGYVGDGSDVLVFSIMVQGMKQRNVPTVRHAQVTAVNAMMRYARGAVGPTPADEVASGLDYEVGEDLLEAESEEVDKEGAATPEALDDLIKKALRDLDARGAVPAPKR